MRLADSQVRQQFGHDLGQPASFARQPLPLMKNTDYAPGGVRSLRPEGGGGKSFKKPKKVLFPKSIHFLTTEILLPLIYL